MDTRVSGGALVNRQNRARRNSNKGTRGLCVCNVAAQALREAAQGVSARGNGRRLDEARLATRSGQTGSVKVG